MTSMFAVMGISSSYGATWKVLCSELVQSLVRVLLARSSASFVMMKIVSVMMNDGMAAQSTQWTRAKTGMLMADEVSIAALESSETPLLKQVFETTVFVTYFLGKFTVRLTFTSVMLTAVTAAYESLATSDMLV